MNLIEQLGGYENAKKELINLESYKQDAYSWSRMIQSENIKKALLEYRRQHGIFEKGDKVVYKHSKIIHVMTVKLIGSRGTLICDGDYFENTDIQHATDSEIAKGKRDEND